MFENRQNEVDQLMTENIEFRRLYNKHQNLHQEVNEAERGTLPLDDLELAKKKKQKLMAKDQLSDLMNQFSTN